MKTVALIMNIYIPVDLVLRYSVIFLIAYVSLTGLVYLFLYNTEQNSRQAPNKAVEFLRVGLQSIPAGVVLITYYFWPYVLGAIAIFLALHGLLRFFGL